MACEALENAFIIAQVTAAYDAAVYEVEQAEADAAYNQMLESSWEQWNAWYAWQECLAQNSGRGDSSRSIGPEKPTGEPRVIPDIKALKKKRTSLKRQLKKLGA